MWPRFGDIIVIYALLTPLCVLYWHATFDVIDYYTDGNRVTSLIIGYAIVVLSLLLHETVRLVEDIFEYKCIYHFVYDYTVLTACLAYVHGLDVFYEIMKENGVPPIAIAGLMTTFLILLQSFRNVLALPVVVNNDHIVDRYRPHNTLNFFNTETDCIENDIVIVTVVWPAIAFLWDGVGEYMNSLGMDRSNMVAYGYLTMFLLQTVFKEFVETFIEQSKCRDDPEGRPCNELVRVAAEDVYIFLATATTITIWQGLDKYCTAMIAAFGSYVGYGAADVSMTQTVSFTLLWLFGVSMSLFSRDVHLDTEGIHFNTIVFC